MCMTSLPKECVAYPGLPSFRPQPLLPGLNFVDDEVCSQTGDNLFDFEANVWNQPMLDATFDVVSAEAIFRLPPLVPWRENQWLWLVDPQN